MGVRSPLRITNMVKTVRLHLIRLALGVQLFSGARGLPIHTHGVPGAGRKMVSPCWNRTRRFSGPREETIALEDPIQLVSRRLQPEQACHREPAVIRFEIALLLLPPLFDRIFVRRSAAQTTDRSDPEQDLSPHNNPHDLLYHSVRHGPLQPHC